MIPYKRHFHEGETRTKLAENKGDLEDFELPAFAELSVRWYRQLNRLARKYGLTRKEILEKSLAEYARTLEQKSSPFRAVKVSPTKEAEAKQIFGQFAKSWWDSLTPSERQAESQKRKAAAKQRWANERKQTS